MIAGGNHCCDFTAEAIIRRIHHQAVEYIRVCLNGLFHFFRKNLLTTGINTIGAAPVDRYRTVVFKPCFITR